MSCSRKQHSGAGEARTYGSLVLSILVCNCIGTTTLEQYFPHQNTGVFKSIPVLKFYSYVNRFCGGSVVVDFLFIVTPIVGVCNCSMFCCTLLYVHSSIAIILMGKRELVALLNLSSWCLVMVERLFLPVPRGCLRFVNVVFPDHAHLLFLSIVRFI